MGEEYVEEFLRELLLLARRFVIGLIAALSLPEEKIMIEALPHDSDASYSLTARGGALRKIGSYRWLWKAPGEGGVYEGKLIGQPGYHCITLNFFVIVPFTYLKGQYLNGYRIGRYPDIPLNFCRAIGHREGSLK
jgi:hypothetical protein